MTGGQISAELARLYDDFEKGGQINNIRNGLQNIFDECFLNALCGSFYREALDRSFSLLRRVENSALPYVSVKYRFDASYAVEGLCFCADVLGFEKGKKIIFESSGNTIYISADMKSFLFSVSNLLANAVKYSAGEDIIVTLKSDGKNALLCISDSGEFSYDAFQSPVIKTGSLGFAVRFFESSGGAFAMESSDGLTAVAVKLPLAKNSLPAVLPLGIEELLYDRLSVIYTAFCGH